MTLNFILLWIQGYQWLIILLVVLLLFGGKKIPELMRGVGKGVKAFKEGMNDIDNEVNKPANSSKNKKSSSNNEE